MGMCSKTCNGKGCPGCWIFGLPYGGLMRLRRWMYRLGLRRSVGVDVPVVCVGNLTCGGTGKTPMVAWVVKQFQDAGRKPGILTRGYKAHNGRSDEAEFLTKVTGAPVFINADRVAGARQAMSQGIDVLVMDDGFQHMRLRRDLDMVLIDATRPFGRGRACLPFGRMREPRSALRAAGVIVITRCDQVDDASLEKLAAHLSARAPQALIARANHRPVGLIGPDGDAWELKSLQKRSSFAFCGLGNGDAFFKTLDSLGTKLVGVCSMEDHCEYPPEGISNLCESAKSYGAKILVTTQKDGVKLNPADFSLPLFQLQISMEITREQTSLNQRLLAVL